MEFYILFIKAEKYNQRTINRSNLRMNYVKKKIESKIFEPPNRKSFESVIDFLNLEDK